MKKNRIIATVAVGATLALGLTACGSDPTKASGGSSSQIVVGSASFGESEILANIYAGALKDKGIDATTHVDIGQREAYLGALTDGTISLFPEYSGNLLGYYDKNATATAPAAVVTALKGVLPSGIVALDAAPGEDKDSYNVTAATAAQYGLKSIGDLAKVPNLKLAANPEFKTRPYGIPGLASVYGVKNVSFTAIADSGGAATLKALTSGQVTVADIYSTTPSITANHLVTLDDPKHLIAAQSILPIIRKDHDSAAVDAVINAVSAKLTTAALLELNTQFNGPDKPSAASVAQAWLKANGF